MTNALLLAGNSIDHLPRMMVFEAVVRHGGFTAAAEALGASKSHMSKQVRQLETELGVRLLNRTTRVVRPTEAGELFYERCRQIAQLAEQAGRELSSVQQEVQGRLRISVPLTFGRVFLHDALTRFVADFPHIEAVVDMSDRPVDLLREDFDLVVRVGEVTQPELIVRRLTETRRLVVAAPALLDKVGRPERPSDLSKLPCLLYEHQVGRDRWIFDDGGRRQEVRVSGRLRCNNGDLLASAAARGLGFAWLPDFVVQPMLDAGTLVSVLETNCRASRAVHAVLPGRRHLPLKIKELLRYLQEELQPAVSA